MKTLFTFLTALIAFAYTAESQIIDRSDFGNPGDSIWYGIDTTFTNMIPAGAGGSGVSWDYSQGIQPDVHDLTVLHDSSYDLNAPLGTNLIVASDYNGNMNYKIDNTKVQLMVPNPIGGPDLAFRIADFPMAYGKQFSDSNRIEFKGLGSDFGIDQLDSIWLIIDVINRVKCDASGSLKTNSGTYNVIRTRNINDQHVKVKGKGTLTLNQWIDVQQQDQSSTSYTFLGKASKYYIAQINVDSNDNITDITYMESAGNATAVKGLMADLQGMVLAPNPTADQVRITFPNISKSTATATVYDITGKVVLTSESTTGNQITISTMNLNNGVYFLGLSNGAGQEMKKFTVIH